MAGQYSPSAPSSSSRADENKRPVASLPRRPALVCLERNSQPCREAITAVQLPVANRRRIGDSFGGRPIAATAPILAPMSPLSNRTVATIGSGVMAESIIAGLLRGKLVGPRQIVGSEPRQERRDELARQYGVRMTASNVEAAREADVILLSVKPQTLTKVGHELGGNSKPNQLVVSIVAGATCRVLTGLLGHREVVRSMPNTPAQIGRGMTVWYADARSHRRAARAGPGRCCSALGVEICRWTTRRFVEMATAVSGTGPAYVFLVMEALIDAPSTSASRATSPTTWSSRPWRAARPSPRPTAQHPAVLRNMVTSPGGTSAAAIHELESGRLRTVLSEAVWASYRRTVELGADSERPRSRRRPGRGEHWQRPVAERREPGASRAASRRPLERVQ